MNKAVKTCFFFLVCILITSCAAVVKGNIDFSKIPHKSAYPQKPAISNTTIYFTPSPKQNDIPKKEADTQNDKQNRTPETIVPDEKQEFEGVTTKDNVEEGSANTAEITEPDIAIDIQKQTGNRVVSILFLPLKDSLVKTNVLSSRIRSIFAYENPDILIINGIDRKECENIAILFPDYTPYYEKEAVILCANSLNTKDSPVIGINTVITTYTSDETINIDALKKPVKKHIPSPDIATIKDYSNTPIPCILALSPHERSNADFSAWSDISRKQAEEYWTVINTLEKYDFYDAVENSRYNSSSSGPLYSDWTYKKENDEIRMDFLMLRGVGVANVYTMDIADISTSKDTSRRGIFAHLVIETEN